MEFKKDIMYCYAPDHPLANKAGKVYEHPYVIWQSIGRLLTEDECVHHIDRDRSNNKLENLMLLTQIEHHLLHAKESGYEEVNHVCNQCGESFVLSVKELAKRKSRSTKGLVYCSPSCSSKNRKQFEISTSELKHLVWTYPTTIVGQMLGVSDKAIENRCKKLDVAKPPRGYWEKQRASQN